MDVITWSFPIHVNFCNMFKTRTHNKDMNNGPLINGTIQITDLK